MAAFLSELDDTPRNFSDSCAMVSLPLIQALTAHLPPFPELVLSVGCGAGLLEALLLHSMDEKLNICGVEVPLCINKHLPDDRLLRVPSAASLHPDAIMASALMFVYPRTQSLVGRYLETFIGGALEKVFWLGNREDWSEAEQVLRAHFSELELVAGPGLPEYELLAIASIPCFTPRRPEVASVGGTVSR